jgi:succinoglycan biosynthesis transport protein ExoP
MDRELRKYLDIIKHWWWLVIISAIIPMAITYYFASKKPDIYQARATLLVGAGVFQDPNPDSREMDLSNTLAGAYAELVKQRPILEPVIQTLGLKISPEELSSQIGINIRSGAQLLEIQVTDTDPEIAALIANALADELIRLSPASGGGTAERREFIEKQLEETAAKIERVDEQIDELTASLAELTSAAEIKDAQDRIDALEQVKTRYQTVYAGLITVSGEKSPSELSLFQPAVVPGSPVPRKTVLIVAVSGVAGTGVAIGAVLLMEYLDTSVKWSKDSPQSLVGLPVLGAIPQDSRRESYLSGNPLSPIAEALRSLRVNMFLIHPQRPYTTLLLTSPGASEGKSFVVANLAVALASGGSRVIVVDSDMRRPALHELLRQTNIIGLSEMLSGMGDGDIEPAAIPLQDTSFENLRLLSAGRLAADPTALLTSSRLPALLASLKDEADIVLIDSPPILEAPDARLVATLVEGTILVASAGNTRMEAVQRAKEELLAHEGVNLLGIVVNRVKQRKDYYYSTYVRGGRQKGPKSRGQDDSKGWLTPGEAAEVLGISKSMTREWCKNGRLPATRKWLSWRIDWDGFAQMLEDTWDVKSRPRRAGKKVK